MELTDKIFGYIGAIFLILLALGLGYLTIRKESETLSNQGRRNLFWIVLVLAILIIAWNILESYFERR